MEDVDLGDFTEEISGKKQEISRERNVIQANTTKKILVFDKVFQMLYDVIAQVRDIGFTKIS